VAARRNRTVTYDPLYDQQLAEIHPDFFRADECLGGLLEVLLKDPTLGYQSRAEPNVWYYPLARDDFPPVTVFYTFDDARLVFLSIRRLDEGNGRLDI